MIRRRPLLLAGLAAPALARAQGAAWPNRPVRILNPYAPGGTSDIVLRPLLDGLQRAFGQPFVIDNRPGAGGALATGLAAAERPDGHTLLVSNTGPLAVAPKLFRNLTYDPARSFSWITLFGGAPILCAVKSDGPLRDLRAYAEVAKARPEAVSFGSSGVGSAGHLTGALFGLETGVRLLHIPFRGASEAQQSVLSGDNTSLWDTSGAHAGAVRGGGLRGLCVTSEERISALPDVPTAKELGFPGVVSTNWFLLAAPAGLDAAIAQRLREAVQAGLAEPAVRQRLEGVGFVSLGDPTPDALGAFVASEGERWSRVVRDAGVTPG